MRSLFFCIGEGVPARRVFYRRSGPPPLRFGGASQRPCDSGKSTATLSGSIYRSWFFMQKIVLQDKVDQISSPGNCQSYDRIGAAIIHPCFILAFQGTTSVNNIGYQPARMKHGCIMAAPI